MLSKTIQFNPLNNKKISLLLLALKMSKSLKSSSTNESNIESDLTSSFMFLTGSSIGLASDEGSGSGNIISSSNNLVSCVAGFAACFLLVGGRFFLPET